MISGTPSRIRRGRVAAWALILSLAGVVDCARAQVIRGRVVDQDGRAVAGVPLALKWKFQAHPVPDWTIRTEKGPRSFTVITDQDGRFEGQVDLAFAPLPLYALDHGGRRGAVFVVTAENAGREITLELQNLVRVHGTFVDNQQHAPLTSSYIHVAVAGTRLGVASDLSTAPTFSVDLPPGRYSLRFCGTDRIYVRRTLDLKPEPVDLDLGQLLLPLRALAKHYGKKPPELTVSDAQGVGKGVRLGDYRDQWVLLEFWGHW